MHLHLHFRSFFALAALLLLSGCLMTPRVDFTESLYFNYLPASQSPMDYSDMLCCYDCNA